jgi:hypothetical protein
MVAEGDTEKPPLPRVYDTRYGTAENREMEKLPWIE